MTKHKLLTAIVLLLLAVQPVGAQTERNLLRNGDFQDDWLTLLPETKNHHWCYSSEFFHRRDFNPDGWSMKGAWQWHDAEQPAGKRRLTLHGPANVAQRVNWVLVHDGRSIGGLADAGGFPQIVPQRSKAADRLVRDLTFKVLLAGKNVPAKAGAIEVGLCPPGQIALSDPLGTATPPTVTASIPLPEGTFAARWVEVKLSSAAWAKAVREASAKNPKELAEEAKAGPILPGTVSVSIRYDGKSGELDLVGAALFEPGPASPNLVRDGGFEEELSAKGSWTGPTKYRHFPGRLYYLFNTWHNSAFDNRGKVALDPLVVHSGRKSLRMTVPSGDELAMTSPVIALEQKEPRLIEVLAMVKTDCLAMLHLDAVDDKGERLDGYPFIHMAPHSIGTNDWRLVRQVFRPRQALKSMRLLLCARGTNGYTLDDTGHQPQNNVVGTIWWDDVSVHEIESTAPELQARGVKPAAATNARPGIHLMNLDLGERLLGDNVLSATIANPEATPRQLTLAWEFESPSGKQSRFRSAPVNVGSNAKMSVRVPYVIEEPCPDAYTEYRGKLSLEDDKKQTIASSELSFATWTVPIDIDLGALYLRPEQKQYLRMNLGLSAASMKRLAKVKIDVLRRGAGDVLRSFEVPAGPVNFQAQLTKIPLGQRDDFTNLLLTDLDVSFLPLQPFHDPQRNWVLRVAAIDQAGKTVASVLSPPFCRQGHEPAQPPVQAVAIKDDLLFVNSKPWMPWGVVYGHVPVYEGPADPGKYLDLHNIPAWSMYDRFTPATYSRKANDFNCLRYVAGSVTDAKNLEKAWSADNLYASSAFVAPQPVFSLAELEKSAGGKDKLLANLAYCRSAPMVVSTAPGIEEAFGLFHEAGPDKIKGLEQVVSFLRQQTGKPVMVGHGGYWTRLELEKVPFFDIFDPETEPLYPANLHTDLAPIVKGKNKAVWLRPQMYEDVPYERWRFHVFVELMRGCRGWQIAHGPGDASLFRGLHGELEYLKPAAYSREPGPEVRTTPTLEHWSRRHDGKTYLIAASTRGLTFGRWHTKDAQEAPPAAGMRCRVTSDPHLFLSETNSYGADQKVERGPSIHGIQNLPLARTWPAGTKLMQWVRIDPKTAPANLVILAKSDGRWTHAASWGKFDVAAWSRDADRALWFLRSFYRHSYGFLGWGVNLVDKAKVYMPAKSIDMGALPTGAWTQLEVPLEKIGATGLLDGIGFAHEGGEVDWGRTSIVAPDGKEVVVWGDSLEHPAAELAKTRIDVAGLKPGTPIRVLFEDRQFTSQDGYFVDDFRGQDLYQRFGGGYGVGYGSGPVALHIYEVGK